MKNTAPYFPAKNAGYKPKTGTGPEKKKDPRESFSINKWPTQSHAHAAVLPPVLNEARPQIQSFQKKVQTLNRRILQLIALALGLPEEQFTSCHSPEKENFDNFDLMHYPPIDEPQEEDGNASERSAYRISPHTDWGSTTYLFQRDVGGLEVRPSKYTSPHLSLDAEEWTPAPVHNDMILVNIGDMLEFWTAGALKSTWHRVVPNTLAQGNTGQLDRYAIAYFVHQNKDVVLWPLEQMKRDGWLPRYKGIGRTAAEHIAARIGGEDRIPPVQTQADNSPIQVSPVA